MPTPRILALVNLHTNFHRENMNTIDPRRSMVKTKTLEIKLLRIEIGTELAVLTKELTCQAMKHLVSRTHQLKCIE